MNPTATSVPPALAAGRIATRGLAAVSDRRWARTLATGLPGLCLFGLFLVVGFRGVDFGDQWDEKKWHIETARDMIGSGILLPRAYIYPALSKWMVMLPALPVALAMRDNPRAMQNAMKAEFAASDYLLRVRRIFIFVSGLTVVWVYGMALALRRRWWEATIAAAAMALSWEFGYHARFVANDCILAQFAALTLFLLTIFHRTRRRGWLYGAAVSVGFATGTKYPGVLLLMPVLISSVMTQPLRLWGRQLRRAAALAAVAFGSYLVTTPGTLLDPFVFIEHTRKLSTLYVNGFYGYSVTGAWDHTRLVLTYFLVSFFSPFKLVSALVLVAAVAGAVLWVRADRRMGGLLLCFPLGYLIFFCVSFRVMIIRNYLLVGPFLALFAGRGVAELIDRLRWPWARGALVVALAAVGVAQSAWLLGAAETIRHPDLKRDARDAVAYVADHPAIRYRVSARVRALAAQAGVSSMPPNVTEGPDASQVVLLGREDSPHVFKMKTNDPWFTVAVFGPREMNFNWYTTWESRDRVVVMTVEKARATGIALAFAR